MGKKKKEVVPVKEVPSNGEQKSTDKKSVYILAFLLVLAVIILVCQTFYYKDINIRMENKIAQLESELIEVKNKKSIVDSEVVTKNLNADKVEDIPTPEVKKVVSEKLEANAKPTSTKSTETSNTPLTSKKQKTVIQPISKVNIQKTAKTETAETYAVANIEVLQTLAIEIDRDRNIRSSDSDYSIPEMADYPKMDFPSNINTYALDKLASEIEDSLNKID